MSKGTAIQNGFLPFSLSRMKGSGVLCQPQAEAQRQSGVKQGTRKSDHFYPWPAPVSKGTQWMYFLGGSICTVVTKETLHWFGAGPLQLSWLW